MHESEKWKGSRSVVSNSLRPHGLQPTRLLCPWDFPGRSIGVGCHCLLRIKHLLGTKSWTKHVSSIYSCNLINWVLFYPKLKLRNFMCPTLHSHLCLCLSDFKLCHVAKNGLWGNITFVVPPRIILHPHKNENLVVNSRKSRTALFLSALSCLQVIAWKALVSWSLKTVTHLLY